MSQQLQALTGANKANEMGGLAESMPGADNPASAGSDGPTPGHTSDTVANAIMKAQTPMTDYGARLAARSSPNMNERAVK